MICAWNEVLGVLPAWMRKEAEAIGPTVLQEIRLRINSPPEFVGMTETYWLKHCITQEDLNYTVNAASRYSPWAATSMSRGYLTMKGGHRIGLCGEAIVQQGTVTGIKHISSLCIRIAKDFPGIAAGILKKPASVLILGPPGWGKTTLLRDLIRQSGETGHVGVVDERGELFPEGICRGKQVDVLTGCSKGVGIPMLIRTMGPRCIAADEITEPEDTLALLYAANCGVCLLATAHAFSVSDFRKRTVYHPLIEHRVFDIFIVLKENKSYTTERVEEWVSGGSVQY